MDIIYDNEDLNYILSPTYNWVEIDAREGGPGSHLSSFQILVIIKMMLKQLTFLLPLGFMVLNMIK